MKYGTKKERGWKEGGDKMEAEIFDVTSEDDDKLDLQRFVKAQEKEFPYAKALAEIRAGNKVGCWMWFVFPQISGVAPNPTRTSALYAIKSVEEAAAYLEHPVLGVRLIECSEAVFGVQEKTVTEIFSRDVLKLQSSMTLFSAITGTAAIFVRVLDKYFNGERDERTMQILAKQTIKSLVRLPRRDVSSRSRRGRSCCSLEDG